MKKGSHHKMTSESPMYVYATEMVSQYYKRLDLKNKRVLSIVGSGDQIINAYYFGAKEVIGFDINKRAAFMLDLKKTAIINLNYKEFLNFFGSNLSNGTLSFKLYSKFCKGLPLRTQFFFDTAYKEYKNNGQELIKSDYFRQRAMMNCTALDVNAYLKNEKTYLKCRNIINNKKCHFLDLDLNDILTNKKLVGRFDLINLSNVPNYFTGDLVEKEYLSTLSGIIKKISKRLSKDAALFYYSYSPSLYERLDRKMPPASLIKMIFKIKENNKFKLDIKRFNGVNKGSFDRINIFSL